MTPEQRKLHDSLIQAAIASGKLIEVGFICMRFAVMSPDAPDVQVREMRMAFMAGAQHLFASVLSALDPGDDPTEAELNCMNAIDAELAAFGEELKLRVAKTGGAH